MQTQPTPNRLDLEDPRGRRTTGVRVTLHAKDNEANRIIGALRHSLNGHSGPDEPIYIDDSRRVVRALHSIDPNWRNHLFCRVEPPSGVPLAQS